jgi:hypothetical protein
LVEGVVGGGLGVVGLLALGRAEVVAGGIGPWVVVVGGLVGHGGGVFEGWVLMCLDFSASIGSRWVLSFGEKYKVTGGSRSFLFP